MKFIPLLCLILMLVSTVIVLNIPTFFRNEVFYIIPMLFFFAFLTTWGTKGY